MFSSASYSILSLSCRIFLLHVITCCMFFPACFCLYMYHAACVFFCMLFNCVSVTLNVFFYVLLNFDCTMLHVFSTFNFNFVSIILHDFIYMLLKNFLPCCMFSSICNLNFVSFIIYIYIFYMLLNCVSFMLQICFLLLVMKCYIYRIFSTCYKILYLTCRMLFSTRFCNYLLKLYPPSLTLV